MMFSSSIHLPTNFKMSLFFYCVVLHFPYPFFGWVAFKLFLGYEKQFCYAHSWVHIHVVWLSMGIYLKEILLGPNFLRNRHTDIQRGWTNLHSHQQCRSVPFTPHPLQHKLSSVFLILAILTGVRWNLRVFWFAFFWWLMVVSIYLTTFQTF